MVDSVFVCPACGYEDNYSGTCPDCVVDLEANCRKCGNPVDECVCENEDEVEGDKKE